MNTVVARSPKEFSSEEIKDFMAFVVAGGEVSPNGLEELVMNANCIALMLNEKCLVGIAGLKRPRRTYRQRIQKSSNTSLPESEFPFELGWVFVLPSARGAGLSLPLCQAVIAGIGASKIFATSAENKHAMHRTLGKLGFVQVGSAWASTQNEGNVLLFTRHAA